MPALEHQAYGFAGGLLNENRVDLYQQYAEDDEAESTEEAHPDTTSDTYTLYMKGELYARLWDAYDKFEYTEQMMLAQRLGFCFDCHFYDIIKMVKNCTFPLDNRIYW